MSSHWDIGELTIADDLRIMTKSRYYSPRLNRALISPLYHAAKARRMPMTVLASTLIADGLSRMDELKSDPRSLAEAPTSYGPPGRRS